MGNNLNAVETATEKDNAPYIDPELQELRRYLHQNPEVSWQEFKTAEYIIGYYKENFQPDDIIRLGGHGIAFIFNGKEDGKTVLVRTELDALPIQEINDFDHKSNTEGVSHKCGHDGHMTMVAGVAKHFAKNSPEKGRIVLLYQPAEETGNGAKAVFEDPEFEKIKPDMAFSLHNVPGYDMHQIRCKTGSFTPAVKSMIITLGGVTAHAAKPETGINPALAIADIIKANDRINTSSPDGCVSTLVHTVIGEKAYGISAGYGEVHVTMRGRSNEDLQMIWDELTEDAKKAAKENKLEINFDYTEEFMANMNDDEATEMVRKAAKDCGFEYVEMDVPNPWGEDFGYISSNIKGVMFGLGSGISNPDLHNPDYDFPDEIINTGKSMFVHLINQALS